MRIATITLGLSALTLAACGGQMPGGYPEQDRQAVLTACKGGGAPEQVCECALKKIEAKFTYAEFAEWNAALEQGRDHPASAQAEVMTNECVAEYLKTNPQ